MENYKKQEKTGDLKEHIDSNFYDNLKEKIFKMILERTGKSQKILDVGCGNCELALYLIQKGDMEVVGIDIEEKFLETFENIKRIRNKANCIKADARNLSMFSNETFDVAISLYSLHEFSSPSSVLKECARVVKDKIIIIDFIRGTLAEKLWGERYFSSKEIEKMVEKTGFEILEEKIISQEGPILITGSKRVT